MSSLRFKLLNLLKPASFRGRLGPEARIQKAFVDELKYLTLDNKLDCVWAAIPNENGSNDKPIYGAMLRSLGKIAGAPDMIFMWGNGSGCLEFKAGSNKQNEKQKIFDEWCQACNVKYKVVKSKEDALNTLHEWGLINEQANMVGA